MNNLELLKVYQYKNKKRYGKKKDGGYVIGLLKNKYDCYISCGVGTDESFTRDFLKEHNYLSKNDCYAFDGTINDYPYKYTKNITFIKKNINNYNNKFNTDLTEIIKKYKNIFLSIDIEGGEYDWLLSLDNELLNNISQIVIEFHNICSGFKSNKDNNIIKTFKKLSNKFTLIHAHGNNFGLILNNIPDIIELTYINKSYIKTFKLNNEILPIKDLDFPNSRRYHDINLGFYPFTNNLYIHSPKTMLWYFLNFRKYIQSFIFISVIIIINYIFKYL